MDIESKTEVIRRHTHTITLTDEEEVALIGALNDASPNWLTTNPAYQLVVALMATRKNRSEETR